MGAAKRWGLWQQAWYAVVQRGSSSQSLRKVKGHATKEDILKGINNKEDKEGNNESDKLVDEGVERLQGSGFVKLTSWIVERHDKYGSFIKRVQKFIAGVLIAEKERRAKDKQVSNVVLGYDPDKWVQTNVDIRIEDQNEVAYKMLEMPRPSKGNTSIAIARSSMKTYIVSCNIGNGHMPTRREMQAA